MEKDFLKEFIIEIANENEKKIAQEKKKKYFQELGKKGGLKKKNSPHLSKVISFRVTEFEYEENIKNAIKYNIKLSTYARMVYMEKELKINEFQTDEILLQYGTYFKKITNLLRNREWNLFENKKEILQEIEIIIDLIKQYLYSKKNE
ncbi:special sigma factor [Chryseobacterium sp. CH21]|uniref:plasmid mobilization protein n=1 Tax=Chryseobacterium sp. CH21 TaxID=713556 RepID=UPI00100A9A62|nr:special sigma factor [Chryseobacterium sp. CH21]RXM40435.1 special sigma factor [Chryseobacterium sp. CH21]